MKFNRLSLYEDHLNEAVRSGSILTTIDGQRVGHVNGLTVYDLGDHSFGKVARISATSFVSDDGFIHVDRMSKLSGKIHDKELRFFGFLRAILARENSLGPPAQVCFEQFMEKLR